MSKHLGSAEKPFVSVVICTHNRYHVLAEAIASVELQDCSPDAFELLVVDNSSNLVDQAAFRDSLDIDCPHRYLTEAIAGLSRARNIGVREARGDVVAFMDDDARASPGWVSGLVATFQGDTSVGIAGGPVRPIWPGSRPIWLHPWLEGYLTIVDRGPVRRALAPTEWLAGTNIAFRRDLLLNAGLFNENLGRIGKLLLSNEELSITTRIREAGYSVIYDPVLEMHHCVHADRISQSWMRRRVFWQIVSDLFSESVGDYSFTDSTDKVLNYLSSQSPKDRGLSGLFLDLDDADTFHQQTEALAALVRVMALDGRDWRSYLTSDAR